MSMRRERRSKYQQDPADHSSGSGNSDEGEDTVPSPPRRRRNVKRLVHRESNPSGAGGSSSRPSSAARARDVRAARAAQRAQEEADQGRIHKDIPDLDPDFLYTYRDVDRRRAVRATDYTRKENHSLISRDEDPTVWETVVHDHRLWNNFQANWYITVIKDRPNAITPQQYVDWDYMEKKRNAVFDQVIAKASEFGFFELLGMWQNWNKELVAQFCSTAWFSGSGKRHTIHFSLEGNNFSVSLSQIVQILRLASNDLDRMQVATEAAISDLSLAPLYLPGNNANFGSVHGLLPWIKVLNSLFRVTLTPKRGDRSSINGTSRNLLLAMVGSEPVSIGRFFWAELLYMLRHGSSYVIYAPYIQRIIHAVTGLEFQCDSSHTAYRAQVPKVPPPVHSSRTDSVPESSGAAPRRDNVVVRGLKAILSMCERNDDIISRHVQETQASINEMRASMSLPPTSFTPLPPPVADTWAWYNELQEEGGDDIQEEDMDEDSSE